jgi:hypothetical protein
MSRDPTPPDRPAGSGDEYRVLLVALGPGVLAAAAVYWLIGEEPLWRLDLAPFLLGVYFWTLLGALPGLSVLALCLARALPRRPVARSVHSRVGWLAASVVAPFWHLAVIEVSSLLLAGAPYFGPDGWAVLARCGLALWAATVGVWGLYVLWHPSPLHPHLD